MRPLVTEPRRAPQLLDDADAIVGDVAERETENSEEEQGTDGPQDGRERGHDPLLS